MKLNLGCGGRKFSDHVNVDFAPGEGIDLVHDLTTPLPYEDETVDEIISIHVIEHFRRWQVEGILTDWVRVLKPGGQLILECPDLDKVYQLFVEMRPAAGRDAVGMDRFVKNVMWALYGDQGLKNDLMQHQWCYPAPELAALLKRAGCRATVVEPPKFKRPARDMRVIGVK